MRTSGPQKFLVNGNMASTITSNPVGLNQAIGFFIEATATTSGTLAGVFTVQSSISYNPGTPQSDGPPTAGNWVEIAGSATTISGAGTSQWNYGNAIPNFLWVRLVYTPAGGDSGTLNALCNVKGQ